MRLKAFAFLLTIMPLNEHSLGQSAQATNNALLRTVAAALLITTGVFSYQLAPQSAPSPLEESHGTINIIFANQNGLVAVTDSMLTTSDDRHFRDHQKLFRIDDKTVAMMAGSYSKPGIGSGNPNFDLWVPNIMNGFAVQQQALSLSNKAMPFPLKFSRFKETFEHQLMENLQAAVFAAPTLHVSPADIIELTLAGYDTDGSLKVGEVTLTAAMTPGGVAFKASELPRTGGPVPACELRGRFDSSPLYVYDDLPKPRIIENGLFCEIAGLIGGQNEGVAEIERTLNDGAAIPQSAALQAYFTAEMMSRPLSTDELVALALELEARLTKEESDTGKLRIGGNSFLAVLRNGHVESAPLVNEVRPAEGNSLNRPLFNTFGIDCTGTPPGKGKGLSLSGVPDGTQMSITLAHCEGDLADQVIFHDSKFIDSTLDYSGKGPIRFATTNTVTGSTLKIGQNVELNRDDVRDLICNFPWKAVYYGEKQIHLDCK